MVNSLQCRDSNFAFQACFGQIMELVASVTEVLISTTDISDSDDSRVWWYDAMGCEDNRSDSCLNQWQIVHIAALFPASERVQSNPPRLIYLLQETFYPASLQSI